MILATRSVATGRFGKVIRASHQLLSSVAAVSLRNFPAADLLQADSWLSAQVRPRAETDSRARLPGTLPSPAAPLNGGGYRAPVGQPPLPYRTG